MNIFFGLVFLIIIFMILTACINKGIENKKSIIYKAMFFSIIIFMILLQCIRKSDVGTDLYAYIKWFLRFCSSNSNFIDIKNIANMII